MYHAIYQEHNLLPHEFMKLPYVTRVFIIQSTKATIKERNEINKRKII